RNSPSDRLPRRSRFRTARWVRQSNPRAIGGSGPTRCRAPKRCERRASGAGRRAEGGSDLEEPWARILSARWSGLREALRLEYFANIVDFHQLSTLRRPLRNANLGSTSPIVSGTRSRDSDPATWKLEPSQVRMTLKTDFGMPRSK